MPNLVITIVITVYFFVRVKKYEESTPVGIFQFEINDSHTLVCRTRWNYSSTTAIMLKVFESFLQKVKILNGAKIQIVGFFRLLTIENRQIYHPVF